MTWAGDIRQSLPCGGEANRRGVERVTTEVLLREFARVIAIVGRHGRAGIARARRRAGERDVAAQVETEGNT